MYCLQQSTKRVQVAMPVSFIDVSLPIALRQPIAPRLKCLYIEQSTSA